MRVLVCGGRDYDNQYHVFKVLDEHHSIEPISLIIEGGATGADRQARYWALARGIPSITVNAAWNFYGKPAGGIRNGWMLEFGLPDTCLAFPGGSGTANMIKQCQEQGVLPQLVGNL